MITLRSLTLENFLSHSDTKIEFQPNQALLLSGVSGSGKSSLIEAILFALYGKGRISNRFLIKNGKSSAKVIITLLDDNKEIIIERSITKDGKHNLEVLESINNLVTPVKRDGTRELQKYIEKDILCSSYSLFINSSISPQNNSDSFVSQAAAKRKELLLEIVGADKYDEYYKKTKEELEKVKENEFEKRLKIDNLKEYIEENKKTPLLLPRLEEENIELNSKIKGLEKELLEIKEKQSEAKLANSKISEKNDQLEKLTDSMNVIETEIANFQKPKISTASELRRLREIKTNEKRANEWNVKMLEVEKQNPGPEIVLSDNKEIKEEIGLLSSEKTEICPELNKPCPIIVRERNKRIEELKLQITKNNEKFIKYSQKVVRYIDSKNVLGECPETNAEELEQLEMKVKESEEMKEQMIANTHKKEELKVLRIKEKKIEKEIEKLGIPEDEDILFSDEIFCKQKLDETKYAYEENTKLLSVAKNINTTIKSNKGKIKELQGEKKELDKNIESLELLKDAFGNNGIKAIVIDQIIPELENRINEVLGKLSDFRIVLDTQKQGVSEDTVIEGLYIVIVNELGKELDYESFSGGEQNKIANAISSGLATFSKCGFKILDENIVGLDSNTVSSFADIMLKLKKDVNQLICISHLLEIKDCFEEKIEVVKINGNSQIL